MKMRLTSIARVAADDRRLTRRTLVQEALVSAAQGVQLRTRMSTEANSYIRTTTGGAARNFRASPRRHRRSIRGADEQGRQGGHEPVHVPDARRGSRSLCRRA